MQKSRFNNNNIIEIGVDEVAKGPLFGSIYAAATILPINNLAFDFTHIKDSKKFNKKSKKNKISTVASHIMEHAIYHISDVSEIDIDINGIEHARFTAMHDAIRNTINKYMVLYPETLLSQFHILVDGDKFNIYTHLDSINKKFIIIPYTTVIAGDSIYYSIAAASIIAKVAHDSYILKLCEEHPDLIEKYKLNTNMGYPTLAHKNGIRIHGYTQWHRKSFKGVIL